MKNKNESFTSISCEQFSVRKYGRQLSVFLLLIFVNFTIGCSYYKVTSPKDISMLEKQIRNNSKYFIVHHGDKAWRLKNVELHDEQKTMTGVLDTLPRGHQQYLKTDVKGITRYDRNTTISNPTHQVHFYVSEFAQGDEDKVVVPLAAIQKIEMYEMDKGATTASHVFGAIGSIAAVLVIVGVIALLLKSSCPFVYIKEGGDYKFTGEMYGGAIYSSLERDDYMPLPFSFHADGVYELKITNELLERQYTNLAELIVVNHPENAKAILDKNGKVQTIINPEPPLRARSEKGSDYRPMVTHIDSNQYLFNDQNYEYPEESNLMLTFRKPDQATTGKLVLNLKNSYWLDYVYGKFNEQFGTYFNEFAEKQKGVPAQKINQWALDQNIPLSVFVKKGNRWEYMDYFQVIGPLASRDVVMSIDLSDVPGEEVTFKLESGFMFWELDYAAMDYSENIPSQSCHVATVSAIDENGLDISKNIAASDNKYLVQPNVGNEAFLKFNLPVKEQDVHQSLFLHSRGYYEYIRDYQNKPDFRALSSFKEKGSFTKFSKEQYLLFVGDSYFFESAITATDGK